MSQISHKLKWHTQNAILQVIARYNLHTNRYKSDNFIWINGSGRSGTTWLGELLTTIPNSTLIDEPLKRSDSKYLNKINLRGIQYIPQGDDTWKEFNNYMDLFFKGAFFNPNHFHLDIKDVFQTKQWIVKEIRSHLMLPWVIDRYQIKKVINIVRNPYQVIGSQLLHGAWNNNVNQFDFSNFKYQEFYKQYEHLYKSINSNIEYLAFEWCLQNSYLLNHDYNDKKWLNIRYENLQNDPIAVIDKIFTYLQLEIPKNIYNNLNKISFSGKSNEDKKQLNTQQIETINYYLKMFNISHIND